MATQNGKKGGRPAKGTSKRSTAKSRGYAKRKGRAKAKKGKSFKVGPMAIAAAVLILVAAISLPHIHRLRFEHGAAVPQGSLLYMLDVSHHQKSIQWDSLRVGIDAGGRTVRDLRKASRIRNLDYVVMKATEGENYKDDRFAEYWQASLDAGFKRGAYLFFLPGRDPKKQAQNFIRTVGELRHKDLAPIVDAEVKPKSMSNERYSTLVLECIKELEAHYGRKPIIYANDNFLNCILSKDVLAYPVWVAHYETEKPVVKDWLYWQFTDRAVVHGVEGKVDLSVIR